MVIAAVSGIDSWKISVIEKEGKSKVTMQVSTQSQAITPMATSDKAWTATTMPMYGAPVQGTAIYDIFWARLDYLLGERTKWMTCKAADQRVDDGMAWGTNEALCNSFNINDDSPL